MTSYVARRVLGLIPLLFGISLVSYALIGLAPGGAAGVFAGLQRQMTEADRQIILHNLGLDKPWYVQYFYWLKNLLIDHSLGNSYIDGRPVLVKILEKAPVTLEVIGLSFLCTLLIAIPIAVYAATHKNSIFDHLATLLAFVGYGAPTFWVAIMLLEFFSVQLRWLPAGGLADIQSTHFDLWERVKHLILPVGTLTFVGMASWMRYQRAAMLEVSERRLHPHCRGQGTLAPRRHLQACPAQRALAGNHADGALLCPRCSPARTSSRRSTRFRVWATWR